MRQGSNGENGNARATLAGVFGPLACTLVLMTALMTGCGSSGSAGGGSVSNPAQSDESYDTAQGQRQVSTPEPAKPAKKETDPVMRACEEEAREYFEHLDEYHAEQRSKLEDSGMQTFEGTVVILGGEEVCALSGVPITANGESCATEWRNSQYALLKFDQPTEVRDIMVADSHITDNFDYVCIGRNDYNNSSLDYWREFEGKRICVVDSFISKSSGVDLLAWPSPRSPWVLYRVRSASVNQMLDHDFNHKYFYVDVPDSWADEDWTVEKVDDWTYTFTQTADGQGSAIIAGGNGLPNGYEILGTVSVDGGLIMKQEGDGFFGDGKAKVGVRSWL